MDNLKTESLADTTPVMLPCRRCGEPTQNLKGAAESIGHAVCRKCMMAYFYYLFMAEQKKIILRRTSLEDLLANAANSSRPGIERKLAEVALQQSMCDKYSDEINNRFRNTYGLFPKEWLWKIWSGFDRSLAAAGRGTIEIENLIRESKDKGFVNSK